MWDDTYHIEYERNNLRLPNRFDSYIGYDIHNTLGDPAKILKDWVYGLKDQVADSGHAAHRDGRAELLKQMAGEGIFAAADLGDFASAIEIVKTTRNINHVNWAVYKTEIINKLRAGIVN